jgi:hypothetical protein
MVAYPTQAQAVGVFLSNFFDVCFICRQKNLVDTFETICIQVRELDLLIFVTFHRSLVYS